MKEQIHLKLAFRFKPKTLLHTILFLALFGGLSSTAFGYDTLRGYEERVQEAAEHVKNTNTRIDDSRGGVDYIKSILPSHEEVNTGTGSMAVDNSCLYVMLDSYRNESDPTVAHTKLKDIHERLQALSDELADLEDASNTNSENVQDQRQELKKILDGPEFRRKKEDAVTRFVREAKEKLIEFVRRLLNGIFSKLFGAAGEASPLFRGLIILVILAVLGASVFVILRSKGRKPRKKKKITILGEEIDADSSSSDLAANALAAARAGDFRTAVRRLYIALLYGLAESHLIELEENYTNHEYLREVASNPGVAGPMGYLTDRFDYFWYGMFSASQADFDMCYSRYKEAIARIPSPRPTGRPAPQNS